MFLYVQVLVVALMFVCSKKSLEITFWIVSRSDIIVNLILQGQITQMLLWEVDGKNGKNVDSTWSHASDLSHTHSTRDLHF